MSNWINGNDSKSCIKIADKSFIESGTTTISQDAYELFNIEKDGNKSVNVTFIFDNESYNQTISKKPDGAWQVRIFDKLRSSLFGSNTEVNSKLVEFRKIDDERLIFELSIKDNPNYIGKIEAASPLDISSKETVVTNQKKVGKNIQNNSNYPLNIILYGPPGTGKTYNTLNYAVAIIEGKSINDIQNEPYDEVKKRYNALHKEKQIEFVTFHQSYGYEDFIEGIKPSVRSRGLITYKIEPGIFKKFCEISVKDKTRPHVFIIDEINRGNVSRIFGELITSIEETKRIDADEELRVTLPYSKETFGVPKNVYILGTMNTADRSLARIDTALRRRFTFVELMPDSELLVYQNKKPIIIKAKNRQGKEITLDIKEMLDKINERIEVLLSREHKIGHAYFLPLKNNPTFETLKSIFQNRIIPLLQEYFYDDYRKIQLVLGDYPNDAETNFIKKIEKKQNLFRNPVQDVADARYEFNEDAFDNPTSYANIYKY